MTGLSLPVYVAVGVLFDVLQQGIDNGMATTLRKDKVLICLELQKHLHTDTSVKVSLDTNMIQPLAGIDLHYPPYAG